MFSENQSKARIGKVSIDIKANRYRIRFTYPKGRSHELRITQVTDDGWLTALRAAKLINQDIDLGIFDDTYAKYSPTHAKRLELAQKETVRSYNIIELWERYKDLNKDRIAATSQAYWWKDVDRYLSQTPKDLISLDKAQEFLQYLQTRYVHSDYSLSSIKIKQLSYIPGMPSCLSFFLLLFFFVLDFWRCWIEV